MQEEAEEASRKAVAEQKQLRQQMSGAVTAREKENLHHNQQVKSRKGNASKEFVVTEEFAPPLRQKGSENTSSNWRCSWQATYQSGEEKVVAPKTAPWVAVTNKGMADRSEPSLLDIQQEEERQMIEEMKHKQQQQINGVAAAEATRAGPDTAVVPSRQVAWGGAKGMNEITTTKGIWDDPSLSDSGKARTNRNLQSKSERGSAEQEVCSNVAFV
ncbi:hypothetical protein WUBG_15436 [Wuchereria bancrofti]|uniref:Uncharacterized protein n=1 Tax=Wuchereria bancrofti TaxID=6293 RepID=J9E9K4_WUCBA|nr:hypothetical protein WUBG_15436 [Wuchereria bancrofti]